MSKLVLVADDIEEIVTLLTLSLERGGYRVMKARDGAEALAKALEHRPDLAILDVRMPALDGLEVMRGIRDRHETSEMPVILLSAHAHEEDIARGLEAGADDFMRKPFSPRELLDRAETVMGAK